MSIRRSIVPRILTGASLLGVLGLILLGRLVLAQPATIILRDDVAVHSASFCGATWTVDRKWIACGTILRNGFDN